jgi:hypothetical protein
MAAWVGRSVREIVDWSALRRAIGGVKVTEPAVAMRAARQAVKVEKAQDLMRLAGDVGRVQSKAGTRAALDGLKLAEGPRDMSRIARLAATKGGKTRAILKVAGRGAIMLTVGTFNLAMWIFWALLTVLGFVSSIKRMTERTTERYCARRKLRRARERERCERELREENRRTMAAAAAAAEEPPVIFSTSPALAPRVEPYRGRAAAWARFAPPQRGSTGPRRDGEAVPGAEDRSVLPFQRTPKARAGGQ